MQRMVASSIPVHASSTSTRAQSRAGGWIASFDFDGSPTSTPPLSTIASTNESPSDSSTTTSTLTGPFCCNHHYSVTAITTSTGAIAERYAYTAYGQPTILNASGTPLSPQISTLNSRYSYTGREWDATLGLHHFRARWMSPSAGRFLGRDPIGYEGSEWALYNYTNGKSLISMDPSGKSIWSLFCKKKKELPTVDENCLKVCEKFNSANGGTEPRKYAACVLACQTLKEVGCDRLLGVCLKSGVNRNPCMVVWEHFCGDKPASYD